MSDLTPPPPSGPSFPPPPPSPPPLPSPPPPPLPPPPSAPSPPGGADRSVRWLRWIGLAAVAVLAMVVGAVGAIAVLLASSWDERPAPRSQHRYEVRVTLEVDVTAERKEAVRSALSAGYPAGTVGLESREEAWQRFKELYKDQPDLVEQVRPENLPESFLVGVTGRAVDCAALAPVERLPGVARVSVRQLATQGRPGAVVLGCP